MKTIIYVKGSIMSAGVLVNAISHAPNYSEIKYTQFNGCSLTFRTKKEAVKNLSYANKRLKSDLETKESTSYLPGRSLSYDAAEAVLYDPVV